MNNKHNLSSEGNSSAHDMDEVVLLQEAAKECLNEAEAPSVTQLDDSLDDIIIDSIHPQPTNAITKSKISSTNSEKNASSGGVIDVVEEITVASEDPGI